ncbi:MAG: S24/S26 family peptidase [Actinomycetia bacterium]|nr:S24/S26 family peptidase [Actinomycetes bacterium]
MEGAAINRNSRAAVWIAALAALVVLWSQFAPPRLGGCTTILVVRGTSMLPRFHAGDLVFVRRAGDYPVGTLAAYEDVPLHAIFFHQIIGRQGSRYVFKGIHNDFVDSYRPTRSQIIGRFWFALPQVGSWFTFWREPLHAALLVAGISVVTTVWNPRRRRKVGASSQQDRRVRAGRGLSWGMAGAGILTALAVAGAGFSFWSFRRPVVAAVSRPLTYRQAGHFRYSASVAKSVLYPTGAVTPGDPVYVPPASTMTVSYTYHLALAGGAQAVTGTAGLDAELVGTNGWHDTWSVVPPSRFRGDSVTLAGPIDLKQLFGTIAQLEKLTQDSYERYTLYLKPSVTVSALANKRLVSTRFAPSIRFAVQSNWIQLEVPPSSTLAQYLNPTESGSVPRVVGVPGSIALLGRQIPIASARTFGPPVAFAAGVAAGILTWTERRRERRLNPAARIARQYGGMLVDVDQLPFSPVERSIRVGSMEGLVRLADQCERMILHAYRDGQHVYLLENIGESYYFTTGDESADTPLSQQPRPKAIRSESVASP